MVKDVCGLLDELLTGFVSGLVATISFSIFLLIVKPKIKISKEICKDPYNDNLYRIKVVNKSRVILNNLHYSLHYCKDAGDGIKVVQELPPRKVPLTFINKYNSKDESNDYAVRLSYIIDTKKYPLNNATLEFTVMANHSLSSTMKCIKESYTVDNIKEGFFETGKSMKIIISSKEKNIFVKEQEVSIS